MRWSRGVFLPLSLVSCGPSVSGPPRETAEETLLTITGIAPSSGPAEGGTAVVIRGSGFTTETVVTVGGTACAETTYESAFELGCVTPAGPVGEARLVVEENEERASAAWTWLGPDTGDADTDTDTDTDTDQNPVDYCHLQYPCAQSVAAGGVSTVVYGWIYEADVTPGAGAGAGLQVELGVGADGSEPGSGWTWTTMTYNVDKDGLSAGDLANDEYMGTFTAPATAGTYDYCVRASADGGASWTYCDAGGEACPGGGSSDGYSPMDAGALTVK